MIVAELHTRFCCDQVSSQREDEGRTGQTILPWVLAAMVASGRVAEKKGGMPE